MHTPPSEPAQYCTILCYDVYKNMFIDEDGYPVINPYEYITPNDFRLFLERRGYMLVEPLPGVFVELVWPDSEEDVYWVDFAYPREYDFDEEDKDEWKKR